MKRRNIQKTLVLREKDDYTNKNYGAYGKRRNIHRDKEVFTESPWGLGERMTIQNPSGAQGKGGLYKNLLGPAEK